MTDDTRAPGCCDRCRRASDEPLVVETSTSDDGASTHTALCQACAAIRGPQVCHHCQQETAEPIVLGVHHSMSGPGWTFFICPACHRRPVPQGPGLALMGRMARQQDLH